MRILLAVLMASTIASSAWADLILYEGFDYTVGDRVIGKVNPGSSNAWVDPKSAAGVVGTPAQPEGDADLHRIQAGSIDFNGLQPGIGGSLAVPKTPGSNISRHRLPLPAGADPVTGGWNVDTLGDPFVPNAPGSPLGADDPADSLFYSFTLKLTNWSPPTSYTTGANIQFVAGFHWGYSDSDIPNTNVGPTMNTGGAYGAMLLIRQVQAVDEVSGLPLVDEVTGEPVWTGDYQLGIVKNNNGATYSPSDGAPVDLTFDPNFNIDWADETFTPDDDTVFVVGEYHFKSRPTSSAGTVDLITARSDDTARLWVNPVPGEPAGEPSAEASYGLDLVATQQASAGPASTGAHIRSFYFRSDVETPGDLLVDELRIGTTYADVTPSGSVVPDDADFDGDGDVDGADFLTWQRGLGAAGDISDGDANGDDFVDADDLAVWRNQFGGEAATAVAASVPEPATAGLALLALGSAALARTARRRR